MTTRTVTDVPTSDTCANCRHSLVSRPKPCPGCDTPVSIYKCALSGRKVCPCQTPCPLFGYHPSPIFPPPTRTRIRRLPA